MGCSERERHTHTGIGLIWGGLLIVPYVFVFRFAPVSFFVNQGDPIEMIEM